MKKQWLLLGGIVLVGVFLRVYRLDSLPPGPSFDAAFYGLDALGILQGERPIFVPTNSGREALFSYLVAGFYRFLGPGALGIYAASALIGVLTIPAVYFAARELFAEADGLLRRWAPPLAALLLAISYWHLHLSRSGLRVVLTPLFAALVVGLLWRGLRTGSRWALVACGLALGLAAYTYQASRLLPVLVVLACVGFARWERKPFAWRGLLVVGGLAALLALPLGVYAVRHPHEFNARVEDALVLNNPQAPSGQTEGLQNQVVEALVMFSLRGDESPIANLPYRPALDWFVSAAFYLGIAISLVRWRRLPYPFLLAWLAVMLVPATVAGLGVAEKRASGDLPAVMMLAAVGLLVPLDTVRRWAAQRSGATARYGPPALVGALAVGLLFSAAATYRDYFIRWGGDPDLFTHFEAGQAAMGAYIATLPANEEVLISPVPADHVGLRLESNLREGVRSYNGRVCLIVPAQAEQETTYLIVPHDDKYSLNDLREVFPQGQVVHEGPLHFQQPYFLAFRVPPAATAQVQPDHTLQADWNGALRLLGYDLKDTMLKADDKISLTLYYQGLSEMDRDYTVFLHLVGPPDPATGSPVWAQLDSQPCQQAAPTSTWPPGDIVKDSFRLPLPKTIPPGDYSLELGFYDVRTLARLPLVDAGGHPLDDKLTLSQIRVQP